MKSRSLARNVLYGLVVTSLACSLPLREALGASDVPVEKEPRIPRFSVEYMDQSIDPAKDFYSYACGSWLKNNPVPADKSRWGSFSELEERNNFLIHSILESASKDNSATAKSSTRLVGDFFLSAMDTSKINQLGFKPINADLAKIESVNNINDLVNLLAWYHKSGNSACFSLDVQPDAKDSSRYAFHLWQGGISLPDRDYYLSDSFAKQREAYKEHLTKMFSLLGEDARVAGEHAQTVLDIETQLAKASRSRVDLRDPLKNYNKFEVQKLVDDSKNFPWRQYLNELGLSTLPYAIVGQPEFFEQLDKLLKEKTLPEWKTYLRWQVLHSAAPFLHEAVELENFNFFGKALSGQQEQEPRWKRANKVINSEIGEALGQLYVEKHFPPAARERMSELVSNLKEVFKDRLENLSWMSEDTKKKGLLKFDRFTQKIGHPDKFRDYSTLEIKRDDYLGNVRRADAFEINRRLVRVGKPVDKNEWEMTPPTVNAYFNPLYNEIVFPAGILQPPFFDLAMDDAVNYGAIGAVIGHEITHGYDDEGRHYDADGNLVEWWTGKDAKEFDIRAQKVVDEYSAFEALPGLHVNGKLTLGENIADLGGVSIAYDALQRALKKDSSKRKVVDGLSPEQRFFISFGQIWRNNIRDAEAKRRITVDPHSPGRFRAFGPLLNLQEFYETFGIKKGAQMWRDPEQRAKIW